MTDDPVAVLERELVEAARRRLGGGKGAGRFSRITQGVATAAVLIVAVVIAGGAVILLGGHKPTASPAAREPGRQQLINLLGVLRRPQTSADLRSPAIARLLSTYHHGRIEPGWGAPDRPLIRRAILTPWGEGVFLIPVKPAGNRGYEGVAWTTGTFIDCCATASDFKAYGEVNNAGRATGPAVGRGTAIERFIALVPDGVARVQLGHLVMPVRDNVAAAQANGNLVGAVPVMYWFGPDGNVVRRIGDLAGNYRSVALSPPGPGTAASRAAEQDPSTPNRVWVAPPTGGRDARFTVHFRVLLNAADYFYSLSGPCPIAIGTVGHPDDSRGAIWSDGIEPIAGKSWCPGTYRVSVTVSDLGPFGTLKHPAKPFGAATFTVR